MTDGSIIPTSSVYASSSVYPKPTEDGITQIRDLLHELGERRDKGQPFWTALGEEIQKVPDGTPPPRPSLKHPREAEDQVIYYLRFGDRIKIGTTCNLRKRLESVPHDEVLAIEMGGYQLERLRHEQFDSYRISPRSEWFHVHDDLLSHIDMLNSVAA